ncbi:MAG: ABC transporter ATP-binding protein [Reyranellaceae bacterium]
MSPSLLKVRDLSVEFSGVRVLDRVGFDMTAGDCVGIVGESGSGKSVMSLSLLRLIPEPPGRIVEGAVEFDGVDLLALPAARMPDVRGKDIAMIFQEPMSALNPVMTVGEQISEAIFLHEKIGAAARRARVLEMLQLVGIPDAGKRSACYPHEFSGGMRQRVMIAMALACNPKLLIADEPTTALDVTIQAQVLELMKRLRARYRTSILLISHDLGVIADVADRVIVMYCGRIVETAAIGDLFDRPAHPYTEGLLNSIPSRSIGQDRLYQIPGAPPAPSERGSGCSFYPRCPKRMDVCLERSPPLFKVSETQRAACFALPAARP